MNSPPSSLLSKHRLFALPGGSGPAAPAHSLHAEDLVVGLALNDQQTLSVTGWLLPEHFFQPSRQIAWRHILAMREEGRGAVVEDLVLSLRRSGELKAAGGIGGLCHLVAVSPSGDPRLDLHAIEIHDLWRARQAEQLGHRIAAVARQGTGDVQVMIDGLLGEALTLSEAGRRGLSGASVGKATKEHLDQLEALGRGESTALARVSTGFAGFDALTSGMGVGELWILGGRPGMGKTSLGLGVAANLSLGQDEGVALFSMEMKRGDIVERLVAQESGIPGTALMRGDLTPEEWIQARAVEARVRSVPLWIDDTSSLLAADIAARCKAIADKFKARGKRLRLVVIDYLQLIKEGAAKGRTREQAIAEISRALKDMAGALGVTVLALCQLNRDAEEVTRDPVMKDLRESGSLEQDADFVGILFRQKDTAPGVTLLQVCKQRKGPAPASLPLGWIPTCTRFYDLTDGQETEAPEAVACWPKAAE